MPTLVVTHGQNKKSNAGVKISQLTSHGNVLRKVMNVVVMEVGSSMELRLVPTRKN
jgi:hypothetical protein